MYMKAIPVVAREKARARIANRIAKNVDETAANWGDFPNGAAANSDQLARDKLHMRTSDVDRKISRADIAAILTLSVLNLAAAHTFPQTLMAA